jgi:hypothetical protein
MARSERLTARTTDKRRQAGGEDDAAFLPLLPRQRGAAVWRRIGDCAVRIRIFERSKRRAYLLLQKPEGRLGVWLGGYREYVGGLWDEIGKLQFDFMVQMGLKHEHVFLDVACGALRGGRHFIPYLNRGNYLGIDKQQSLIRAGIKRELGRKLLIAKSPEFVVSNCFEFGRFHKKPHFALAQSLFTHLTDADIRICLTNLRSFVNPGMRFYATFFISERPNNNPSKSHSQRLFSYSRVTAEELGRASGWRARYIGDWNHPRDQKMLEYVAE